MSYTRILLAGALCLGLSSGAAAVSVVPTMNIPGLFNTGVDDAGNALVGPNGVADTHYLLLSTNIGGISTGGNAVTFFNGSYAANSTSSRWISHSANGSPGTGTTVFRTTFDLTGLDPSTAQISGLNAVDNAGLIRLNGVDTDVELNGSFGTLVAFSISSGFIAGVNTLDFVVTDFGPPLALRITGLQGTALAAPVPLPASLLLLAPALVGVAGLRRKAERI